MKYHIRNNRIYGMVLELYDNGQMYLIVKHSMRRNRQYSDITPLRTKRILAMFEAWKRRIYED